MENKDYMDMDDEELTILINQYKSSSINSPRIINGAYSSEPDYTDMNEEQLDEVIKSFESQPVSNKNLVIKK